MVAPMFTMFLAGLVLLVTHLGVSSTSARATLVARFGSGGYLLVYSLVAVGAFALLIWLYRVLPRNEYLWFPDPSLYLVAKCLMPIAMILLVGGFMVRNPTNVGMERLLNEGDASDVVRGLLRITRHPFQWSVIIWAVAHLIANGDGVSVVFFSSFLALSGAGSVLLDRKKAATLGAAWQPFAAVTSNVPFAAVFAGRNRLVLRELILPVIVGLAAYALVFYFHEWVSGARLA